MEKMADGEDSQLVDRGGGSLSVSEVDITIGEDRTGSEGASLPSGTETQQLFDQFMVSQWQSDHSL